MGIQGRGPQCCPSDYAGGSTGEWGTPAEVTLNASGVITLTGPGWYTVDTYGDAASDDLVKIEGLDKGDEVILSPANDGRTVVIIDGTYIILNRDITFTMDHTYDCMIFQCIDSDNDICREHGPRVSGGT